MSPAAAVLAAGVRAYRRTLSPLLRALLGPRCRFVPSCSEYSLEALQVHGAWRGARLTAWRLLRCQPYARGGWDPVPEHPHHRSESHPSTGAVAC